MKKKTVLYLLLLLTVLIPVPAVVNRPGGAVNLQAGYGKFLSLKVSAIGAGDTNFAFGMPFDLEDTERLDPKVNPDGDGIEIASWELLSNDPFFDLQIECEPLKWINKQGKKATNQKNWIDYQLTFSYTLTYYYGSTSHSYSPTEFKVYSDGTTSTGSRNPIKKGDDVNTNSFVGFTDGKIHVKLTEAGAAKVKNANSGEYRADVKITLVTGN